jgi:integral membrane protein
MKGSLARYRFMAYLTGVGLLVLTVGVILKYAADSPGLVSVVGIVHGFFFMAYVVCAFDLSLKCKWPPLYTLGVLLSGTIPFLSFVAERKVTHRVTALLAESESAAAA